MLRAKQEPIVKISSSRLILNDGEKAGWASGISLSAWASAVRGQRDAALRTFLRAWDAGRTNRGMADLINLGRTPGNCARETGILGRRYS